MYSRNKRFVPNTLLIIKLDAIGDYVLFRSYLKEIRRSEKFHNYKITLIGNELWKEIALKFDSEFVNDFIWINPSDLNNSDYRMGFIKSIYSNAPQTVIYPCYSRTNHGDELVLLSGAQNKITFAGDSRNIHQRLKIKNDNHYDRLIEIDDNFSFEFIRYQAFFSKLLDIDCTGDGFMFNFNSELIGSNNKIIVFPGASSESRRWDCFNYSRFLIYLDELYQKKMSFYVCGAINDKPLAKKIILLTPSLNIIDKTGEMTLSQLIEFVKDSFLIVANDSGPLHIAAACDRKVIGISNGNNYKRFVPYSNKVSDKVMVIFPDEVDNIDNDLNRIMEMQLEDSKYSINDITVEKVIEKTNAFLEV